MHFLTGYSPKIDIIRYAITRDRISPTERNRPMNTIPIERKSTDGIALSISRKGVTVDSETLLALLNKRAENLLFPCRR